MAGGQHEMMEDYRHGDFRASALKGTQGGKKKGGEEERREGVEEKSEEERNKKKKLKQKKDDGKEKAAEEVAERRGDVPKKKKDEVRRADAGAEVGALDKVVTHRSLYLRGSTCVSCVVGTCVGRPRASSPPSCLQTSTSGKATTSKTVAAGSRKRARVIDDESPEEASEGMRSAALVVKQPLSLHAFFYSESLRFFSRSLAPHLPPPAPTRAIPRQSCRRRRRLKNRHLHLPPPHPPSGPQPNQPPRPHQRPRSKARRSQRLRQSHWRGWQGTGGRQRRTKPC